MTTPPEPPPSPARPAESPNEPPETSTAFDAGPLQQGDGLAASLEAILKSPGRVIYHLHHESGRRLKTSLLVVAAGCLLAYGVIMGLFSGGAQLWAAPVKVAAGALGSALICLPSLYIFSCLCGVDVRLREVIGLLLGAVCLTGILLLGFGPAAWVFTVSTESMVFMGFLHLLFWVIGTYFGLRFLMNGFRFLGARQTGNLVVWCVIFILVSLQMTTTLRPLIGTAETFLPKEKVFFLGHWGNVIDGRMDR